MADKVRIIPDSGDMYLMVIYPFNDKNVTNGFSMSKSDLYQLYSKLRDIFNNTKNDKV